MADKKQTLLEKELAKTEEEQIRDSKKQIFFGIPGIFIGTGMLVFTLSAGLGGFVLTMSIVVLGICAFMTYMGYHDLQVIKSNRKNLEEHSRKLNEQWAREAEERKIIYEKARSGEWPFPTAKFYQLCRAGNVTQLNNEFSILKARQIAEQIILETDSCLDLAHFRDYLEKESLERFLREGEQAVKEIEERKMLTEKQPRDAKPIEAEKTFIQRASNLSSVSGCNKRIKMLTYLSEDYTKKITAMREGEEALKQLGMIYAGQQQKETSWAVMGGIAEGIAGPAAGIMAASNTMANNQRIQEHNESVRKASMDIMSGIPSLAGDRYKLEKERDKIWQQRSEASRKVVLSNPGADKILQNIKVGKATVKKNPSGVLAVSVPLTLKAPFVLDVPENVHMVVDGVLRAEVWFEDKYVDNVYFPLPIYGIPTNMTAEVTLDGMCGQSVEFDGEYTVKIADTQNLWIMEA